MTNPCDFTFQVNYNQRLNKLQILISNEIRRIEHEGEDPKDVCQQVWIKFATKTKKSPTRSNNNVHKRDPLEYTRNLLLPKRTLNFDNPSSSIMRDALTFASKSYMFCLFIFKFCLLFFLSFFSLYSLIVLHGPTQTFVSRHTQDLIYPFMRSLRLTTLPLLQNFPTLSHYYEESCLIENPYFSPGGLDCWPCEATRHIIDLTGFSNFSSAYYHSGIPFFVKDAFEGTVDWTSIHKMFEENQSELAGAFLDQNNGNRISLAGILAQNPPNTSSNFHIFWRINRVKMARVLRRYFRKPYFVPKGAEVSVEHFLFLDGKDSVPYNFPRTEFANVFVTQGSGGRRLVLVPTEQCRSQCRTVSVALQHSNVLFYNWLFWRPMSVPLESPKESLTYIGSFY